MLLMNWSIESDNLESTILFGKENVRYSVPATRDRLRLDGRIHSLLRPQSSSDYPEIMSACNYVVITDKHWRNGQLIFKY